MNRIQALLQKDYQIPKFHKPSAKEWLNLLLFIFAPNILFLILAWYTNTARPILNWDYLWVGILWFMPYRILRFSGSLIFVLTILLDCLMLLIQIFPFLDISAIQYFLPFLGVAPKSYLVGLGVLFLYALFMPFVMLKWGTKHHRGYGLLLSVALLGLGYHLRDVKYADFSAIMGRNNYFLSQSQGYLYYDTSKSDFIAAAKRDPILLPMPADKERASSRLLSPQSNKILLIIAESWGASRKPEMTQMMLQKMYEQQAHFDFINTGIFDFSGSTVQGELRELCALAVENGYALSRLDAKPFEQCLPNALKKQGYQTISLHGTSGLLYDRTNWYQKAGLQHNLFGENFNDLKRCSAFNGVCDSELQQVVGKTFAQYAKPDDKLFFYWLTLTSHHPYDFDDVSNTRFNCEQWGMKPKGEVCGNFKLQTQFFDDLANLIKQPEMKGVEVLVVGDHMPPLSDGEDIYPFVRWQMTSWLHFKIKE